MRGRVSDPLQPLRAAHIPNAPGFAGGWLPALMVGDRTASMSCRCTLHFWSLAVKVRFVPVTVSSPADRQCQQPLHCRHGSDASASVKSDGESYSTKARHLAQRPPSA